MNEQVYSFGKNNLYVNEGLLTSARSRYVSAGVLDRLRNVLRRFYTVKSEGMIRYENTLPNLLFSRLASYIKALINLILPYVLDI